jgi:hypothetical protein
VTTYGPALAGLTLAVKIVKAYWNYGTLLVRAIARDFSANQVAKNTRIEDLIGCHKCDKLTKSPGENAESNPVFRSTKLIFEGTPDFARNPRVPM